MKIGISSALAQQVDFSAQPARMSWLLGMAWPMHMSGEMNNKNDNHKHVAPFTQQSTSITDSASVFCIKYEIRHNEIWQQWWEMTELTDLDGAFLWPCVEHVAWLVDADLYQRIYHAQKHAYTEPYDVCTAAVARNVSAMHVFCLLTYNKFYNSALMSSVSISTVYNKVQCSKQSTACRRTCIDS